jgi:glutamine cyclotransferase
VLWLATTPTAERADPIAAPRGYTVVRTYPHDSTAYTQGLVSEAGGFLLESTGLYGHSDRRRVALATGKVAAAAPLSADQFGEGLALHDGRLYQLTWQSGIAYVADSATLLTVDSIPYSGEGWGLASDGTSLITSDGTDTLRFRDPATFKVRRALGVHFATKEPVGKLNELEYAGGEIFANIYQSDWIVRIDAVSGEVLQILDFSGLMPGYGAGDTSENVLNGIARDPATGHLLVTGKRWPTIFEIALDPRR